MLRCLIAFVAVSFAYTTASFACTPPPGEIEYEGPEMLAMSPEGPLVVPFRLTNASTDIRVLDFEGNDAGGRTRYHDLSAEWSGELYAQQMLMFWTPDSPVTPMDTFTLEWQRDLETTESMAVSVVPDMQPEVDRVEPDSLVFEEIMVTESRCQPVPDDMPGMCPICENVTVPKDVLTATFTLTNNPYIVRRLARFRDGQADSDAFYLWDAGNNSVSRLDFVEGCYVSQAKDLRSGQMTTGEPTCFDRTGVLVGENNTDLNNQTNNQTNNQSNNDEPNPNWDDDSVPTNEGKVKADEDGCSVAGGATAEPWLFLVLAGFWSRRRRACNRV